MKKIAYIILTCEKYLQTRVPWQFQNCFKYINKKDFKDEFLYCHVQNQEKIR